jgi:hypothetical protein
VEGTAVALLCRWCGKPARFGGNPVLPEQERPAMHADGSESCGDGEHLAAPIDPDMISWDMAALS